MRIEQVIAESFGPFQKQQLELAPGMTIVFGPNEAGKSSWFAATYAGLAGRRRQRGRGTRDQAEFKRRHKPWQSRSWRVGVVLQLDGGRRLRLAHNLDNGEAVLDDIDSGRTLSTSRLEHDGGVDGTGLLGLNRDSARATIFVGQAEILRVLDEAEGLQEYLQRAAASTTVDTTVEEALAWVAERKRTQVGAPYVAGRPLGAATAALEAARAAADAARDGHDRLQNLYVEQARQREQLVAAEEWVSELGTARRWRELDELSDRLEIATQLTATLQTASTAQAPASAEDIRTATEVLAAYRDRGAEPTAPDGARADELTAQLEALPATPAGDRRPHDDVLAALDDVRAAHAQLDAHTQAQPGQHEVDQPSADPEALRQYAVLLSEPRPSLDEHVVAERSRRRAAAEDAASDHAAQVRAHAEAAAAFDAAETAQRDAIAAYHVAIAAYDDEMTTQARLLADAQEIAAQRQVARDQAAADRSSQERAAREVATQASMAATRRQRLLIGIGLVLLIAGAGLATISPPAGGGVAVLGIVALIAGVITGRSAPSPAPLTPALVATASPDDDPASVVQAPPPSARPSFPEPHRVPNPGPAPVPPPPDPDMARRDAEIAAAERAQEVFDARLSALQQELLDGGLPVHPDALRSLAKSIEEATSRQLAYQRWTARIPELEDAVRDADTTLRQIVHSRDPDLCATVSDLTAPEVYAAYAEACEFRSELAGESARRGDLEEALTQRRQAEERYRDAMARYEGVAARLAGLVDQLQLPGPDPAVALEQWLEHQHALRTEQQAAQTTAARLEQLLGDQSLAELQESVATAHAQLGTRPEVPVADIEAMTEQWTRRREAALSRVSELSGQIKNLSASLPSVAAAIETEADAERQLESLRALSGLLDFVHEGMEVAKERVNADIAPALAAKVRPWLPRVTGGRYVDVQVDPSTLEVKVLDLRGGYREATVLSHGTTEQIYLLLRLALAELLATTDETAPLILDDVTVQSDQVRTRAFLDLLRELSIERQIVVFTQEDEVVDWGRANLGDRDRLHELSVS